MTKGTPADLLREAAERICARSILSSVDSAHAAVPWKWIEALRAALATKPAEQPAVNMESLNKFLGRDHPTESAGKSPEATDGRRWPATDLGATDEDALAIHRAMKGRP